MAASICSRDARLTSLMRSSALIWIIAASADSAYFQLMIGGAARPPISEMKMSAGQNKPSDRTSQQEAIMNAAEIMARDVLTVTPETRLDVAIGLMIQHRISGLPVVDEKGALVGVMTESDLLRRAETGTGKRHRSRLREFLTSPGHDAAEYVRSHSRMVCDLMSDEVIVAREDSTLDEIIDLMEHHHVRRVPIVRDGHLVGIVSRADLVAELARKLKALPPAGTDDSTVQRGIADELAANHLLQATNITIQVQDGVVTLDGILFDERLRGALIVAAQNVPGVKSVVDQMVWVEPSTGMSLPAAV
jgi:CBS domain-containing protein